MGGILSKTADLEPIEPGLFYEFADLKPSDDAILRFATIYGSAGENLTEWADQIGDMRRAVRLHEASQTRDPQDFDGLLRIRDGRVMMAEPQLLGRIKGLGTFWELAPQPPSHLDEPEKLVWTAETVVKRIADQCIFWGGLRPRFDEDPTPDLSHAPASLLDGMWLQFSRWVLGGGRFLRCKLCAGRFAVGLDTRRVVSAYCSNACKYKAYRRRKRARSGSSATVLATGVSEQSAGLRLSDGGAASPTAARS